MQVLFRMVMEQLNPLNNNMMKLTKIVKGKYIHNNTEYYLLKKGSTWTATNQVTGEVHFKADSLKELVKLCDQEYQIITS